MARLSSAAKYERLRALLVEARSKAGLTQADLARHLKRPQSFVSKYERGERRLDVVEFIEITRAIGLDAADVVAKLEDAATRAKTVRRD